ncbi:MAG: type II CRISPR RNA-guided endonuclease Cas9 [Candidatus Accumulibacter sp.]|jgi:CRISPR-associated endonuclease Csn1|nr:type II CRISPR RNA-guided endonuclease Cas9 [Accumulibacter sp.]
MTYTLGLDIGIASVGWCLLAKDHIIDLGVRAFDKAETAKEGESLNLTRRMSRLMRRRLYRRAWRLKKLVRLLKRHGLIDRPDFFQPGSPYAHKGDKDKSLWKLRVEGLDRLLKPDEWARVIYHLAKHRGFHWISKAEEKKAESDSKGEGGKVKQGLAGTTKRKEGYRTVAEMVLTEFPEAQRNKHGEYTKSLSRVLLAEELALLFDKQRGFGNPFTHDELKAEILGTGDRKSGIFWTQRPIQSVEGMVGHCTFEHGEPRAPKASFTAERHVWLTRLNNLRIDIDGERRALTDAERQAALLLPYQQAGEFTYKQLRTALVKAGFLPQDGFRFAGLSYPSERQKSEGKAKDPEASALVKLSAWQTLRLTLEKSELKTEWQKLSVAALDGNPQQLDDIARVLSIYKDGDEVTAELHKLNLPAGEKMVEALSGVSFEKFHNLSLKALRKIVPFMEEGKRYDEACKETGYHHSQLFKVGEGEHKYLPPFYSGRDKNGTMVFRDDLDIPRNPVVLRALNQARKVVNALIRRYGAPAAVHIEMARDLSHPLDERNKIKKAQDEYHDRNERDKAEFALHFGLVGRIDGREFEKWRLYREQAGKCAYSQHAIDLDRLLEPGYVEVDHALPYSRSFDDSKSNKVLASTKENRNKGNRTPYEYLTSFPGGEEGERWLQFKAFVEGNKSYRQAKRSRLLQKGFDTKESEEFRERNLNDTRYICRFFKNYVERFLKLDSDSKRCVVLSGQMTSYLRTRWGILKIRSESDRHHALDAAVVAACSHAMVKRLADYARRNELEWAKQDFLDGETSEILDIDALRQVEKAFPKPWPHFHHELDVRLKMDGQVQLREEMERLGTYGVEELDTLRPVFVSRAPQRKNSCAAHKDTIYGQKESLKASGGATQKVALSALSLKDLDKLIDPHRNERLYTAIRERLEEYGGKGDKAFPAGTEFRKPDKNGNPVGPVVRTVTMVINKLSGIPIRGGIAKNDTMLRVDVFTKAGRFYLVPVYVHHKVTGLPNRAIVAHKDEAEWDLIDESFSWCFSLHPNDLVRITRRKEIFFGYYASTHRGGGTLSLWTHDRSKSVGKDGFIEGVGVKTAVKLEKFEVDVLGNIYPARPEPRHGLA